MTSCHIIDFVQTKICYHLMASFV